MSDALMLQATAFNLRAAAAAVEDEYTGPQLRLSMSVLMNAIDAAVQQLTSAAVNDIEFALGDVAGAIDQLSAEDAERFDQPMAMLRSDIERLKEATSLPAPLVAAMKALHAKLDARRKAVDRLTYTEGANESDLPHPPDQLRTEALPIRDALVQAGFATPSLDALIEDPASLRLHSILDLMNELEVAIG
jgi:hypothetical protein